MPESPRPSPEDPESGKRTSTPQSFCVAWQPRGGATSARRSHAIFSLAPARIMTEENEKKNQQKWEIELRWLNWYYPLVNQMYRMLTFLFVS